VGRATHAVTVECLAVGIFHLFIVHSIFQEIVLNNYSQESMEPPELKISPQLFQMEFRVTQILFVELIVWCWGIAFGLKTSSLSFIR
jgi:hypothetical protein